MAFKNFYTVKKTINEVEYTAQFNGVNAALEAVDDSYIDGSQNISSSKLTKYLLENVIVNPPNLSADDFDSVKELNEVVRFARDVMNGNLRPSEEKKPAK